ncbi:MAG: Spy/CpxP family protein refolding chaperone [Proteobacteria bacterium]|nr:Spy/CpxP family protein refolding chaperone [Pseudomonadota bacterium]
MTFRPLFVAVPTVLVAAASLAWMTSATASNGGVGGAPQVAQAGPPAAPAQPPAAGGHQHAREHARERPPFSPQTMCQEQLARRIGNRAYLKARLDLKPEQMEAWDAFEKAADAASAKEKTFCASLPKEVKTPQNFAERFTLHESMMKSRSDTLEAVKPSLLALYAALTPEQKKILDRPTMGEHGWMHHRRG